MSLLDLLVALAEKPEVRDEYFRNRNEVMDRFNLNPAERRAVESSNEAEIAAELRKVPVTAAPGEKPINVTFCGVMKAGPHPPRRENDRDEKQN